jgi:group II intron reverse transcriptase/maturase
VTPELLKDSYLRMNPKACPGVDEAAWQEYARDLCARLDALQDRIHSERYKAQFYERARISKSNGRVQSLGIVDLEDKIVQQAVRSLLEQIYEEDFLDFSYGFHPERSQHNAPEALLVALTRREVNWVLDADIRGFFDVIDHVWLMKLLLLRIGDRRVLGLIQHWLITAGCGDGGWSKLRAGMPQGAVISPILANVFLHYVLDLWVEQWRRRHAAGDVVVVRYLDEFVMGFQHRSDAERLLGELRCRMQSFGLELEKTRLIEFGRFAAANRERRGAGKPETFDFLGFTHYCGKHWSGSFMVRRWSKANRLRAKLHEIHAELRRGMRKCISTFGAWLESVVREWSMYHARR